MIAAGLALVALAALLWLANGIRRIGAVSQGRPIGPRQNTALVLVDLQTVFWDDGPYAPAARLEAETAIRAEIAAAKAAGWPVIAVRQEWSIPSTRVLARLTMGGRAVAGTAGTELAPAFAGLPDHVLVKRVQDAFETGALDRLLDSLDVGRLRIVGLDAAYCVAKTALAARRRGYAVEIATRGTLAADPAAGRAMFDRLAASGCTLD
ncbi:MAG: cysteine hydrolase [Maritimibacter sp.]|nr:cysteine hydrolase [Maritimibacter sp.]